MNQRNGKIGVESTEDENSACWKNMLLHELSTSADPVYQNNSAVSNFLHNRPPENLIMDLWWH